MREDFLHYIWKFQKFEKRNLKTVSGERIEIVEVGQHNHDAGPDFFNAKIILGAQLWAGNVELHLKSSDWYAHGHETDKNYDNVVLHVVWQYNLPIFRKDETEIPTLELNSIIDAQALTNYKKLFPKTKKWIYCESDFFSVDDFVFQNWLDRLYIERLEEKSKVIQQLLNTSSNHWEGVLFKMLAKNFGLKINADAFLSIANSIDFSILQKQSKAPQKLEALLMGQAGLLNLDVEDAYLQTLQEEYRYLRHKYALSVKGILPVSFFRLRPVNFPTLRLAQLAALYAQKEQLFSKVIAIDSMTDAYTLFNINTSDYWDRHYNFGSTSKPRKKTLSKAFINLIIINTILPLRFCYEKSLGEVYSENIIKFISTLPIEHNAIVKKYGQLRIFPKSALNSQALLQLKKHYCMPHKCLQCAIGNEILNKK